MGGTSLGRPSGQDQDETMEQSSSQPSCSHWRCPGAGAGWEPQPGVVSALSDLGGGQGTDLGHCVLLAQTCEYEL